MLKRHMIHALIIAMGITVMSGTVFSADKNYPVIKSAVKPQKTTIGVPLTYTITITGKNTDPVDITPPQKGFAFPVKKEDTKKKKKKNKQKKKNQKNKDKKDPKDYVPLFAITGAKKIDDSTTEMTDIRIIVDITFYRPGKFTLPQLKITDKKGGKIGYKLPQVQIVPVNKKGQMEDLEPPLDFGGNYFRLVMVIIGAMIFAGIAVAVYFYIKKKRELAEKEEIVIPPIEIFEQDVAEFGGKDLIINNKLEEYVFGMSMIFRKFLSAQLNFDASEMTSDEIDKMLRKMFSQYRYEKHGTEVVKIFELWDLTKYAEFAPSTDIVLSNHEKAITIARDIARDVTYGRI